MKLLDVFRDYLNKKISKNDLNDFLIQKAIHVKKGKRYRLERTEITKDYEVIIPISTLNSGTKSAVNPGGHAYVPSREMCEALNLTSRPQTFDLYDECDRRASITLKWGNEWHISHDLIYMRKDLLDRYLGERAVDLIWGVWGERGFRSRDNIGLEEYAKKHKTYKVFQDIITYRNIIS